MVRDRKKGSNHVEPLQHKEEPDLSRFNISNSNSRQLSCGRLVKVGFSFFIGDGRIQRLAKSTNSKIEESSFLQTRESTVKSNNTG